jgi:hypothetical protein
VAQRDQRIGRRRTARRDERGRHPDQAHDDGDGEQRHRIDGSRYNDTPGAGA